MKYKCQKWTSTVYWTVFDRISYEAGMHYSPRLMDLVLELKTKGNIHIKRQMWDLDVLTTHESCRNSQENHIFEILNKVKPSSPGL